MSTDLQEGALTVADEAEQSKATLYCTLVELAEGVELSEPCVDARERLSRHRRHPWRSGQFTDNACPCRIDDFSLTDLPADARRWMATMRHMGARRSRLAAGKLLLVVLADEYQRPQLAAAHNEYVAANVAISCASCVIHCLCGAACWADEAVLLPDLAGRWRLFCSTECYDELVSPPPSRGFRGLFMLAASKCKAVGDKLVQFSLVPLASKAKLPPLPQDVLSSPAEAPAEPPALVEDPAEGPAPGPAPPPDLQVKALLREIDGGEWSDAHKRRLFDIRQKAGGRLSERKLVKLTGIPKTTLHRWLAEFRDG